MINKNPLCKCKTFINFFELSNITEFLSSHSLRVLLPLDEILREPALADGNHSSRSKSKAFERIGGVRDGKIKFWKGAITFYVFVLRKSTFRGSDVAPI